MADNTVCTVCSPRVSVYRWPRLHRNDLVFLPVHRALFPCRFDFTHRRPPTIFHQLVQRLGIKGGKKKPIYVEHANSLSPLLSPCKLQQCCAIRLPFSPAMLFASHNRPLRSALARERRCFFLRLIEVHKKLMRVWDFGRDHAIVGNGVVVRLIVRITILLA